LGLVIEGKFSGEPFRVDGHMRPYVERYTGRRPKQIGLTAALPIFVCPKHVWVDEVTHAGWYAGGWYSARCSECNARIRGIVTPDVFPPHCDPGGEEPPSFQYEDENEDE